MRLMRITGETVSMARPFAGPYGEAELLAPDSLAYGAVAGNTLCGFLYGKRTGEELELLTISVSEPYRRRKIASRMLRGVRLRHPRIRRISCSFYGESESAPAYLFFDALEEGVTVQEAIPVYALDRNRLLAIRFLETETEIEPFPWEDAAGIRQFLAKRRRQGDLLLQDFYGPHSWMKDGCFWYGAKGEIRVCTLVEETEPGIFSFYYAYCDGGAYTRMLMDALRRCRDALLLREDFGRLEIACVNEAAARLVRYFAPDEKPCGWVYRVRILFV